MAVEIVNQPAAFRPLLHEADEDAKLLVGHMVGDQAADHEVERTLDVAIIAGPIVDRRVGRRGGARGRGAVRIEVYPDQVDSKAAPPGPGGDPAKHVAMAEADVEQSERL